jgi:uncharacterized protein with PhoU and TrkA domain
LLVGGGWLDGLLQVAGIEVAAIAVIEETRRVGLVFRAAFVEDFNAAAMTDLAACLLAGLQLERSVDSLIVGFGEGLLQVQVQKAAAVDGRGGLGEVLQRGGGMTGLVLEEFTF